MNVKMFGEICDAFGPSGFEEDVIRTVAKGNRFRERG